MTTSPQKAFPIDELMTVRDWLRHGVTRFETAGLVYGHGTSNAVEEAAFLILAQLRLPIDDVTPWLDCRLTLRERQQIADLFEDRISTRKPAPYLVNQAWIGAHKFYVDERVIVPRSFIGELLVRGRLGDFLPDADGVETVLELCTGSGCLAILAALEFPGAEIVASDISEDALAVARKNVDTYGLAGRMTLLESNLWANVPRRRFDLIVANPPYVTKAAFEAFPPEYRAEPALAHLGGDDGLDLVHEILAGALDFLSPQGVLIVEIGQTKEELEEARPDLPFLWIDTETSEGEVFALTAAELSTARQPAADSKAKARKASPPRTA